METIKVAVLHNDKDGGKIRKFLNASAPHIAIVGRWSAEAKVPEIIHWMRKNLPAVKSLAHAMELEEIVPAFLAGASGYVYQGLESIVEGVEKVVENGFYIPEAHGRLFIDRLIETNRLFQALVNASITPREIESLKAQKMEKTRSHAAWKMGVEESPLKSHNRMILKKLGMKRMKDVIALYGQCLEEDAPATSLFPKPANF